jgi:hypothetical protein
MMPRHRLYEATYVSSDWLSLAGFLMAAAGVWLTFGLGWALIAGGVVLFVAGGLDARRA